MNDKHEFNMNVEKACNEIPIDYPSLYNYDVNMQNLILCNKYVSMRGSWKLFRLTVYSI